MPKIKDCRGYIIDIRNNGGGNSDNADRVVQAFIEGEFTYSTDRELVHNGAYKAWGKYMDLDSIDQNDKWSKKVYDICKRQYFECNTDKKKIDECPFTLTAPLVVLENDGTASSAEDMLIDFDAARRATIVGTPSYGSTGNPLPFNLPGGGGGRICTRWNTYPDGKEFINIGVIPQVYASPTPEELRSGRDGVLDTGIKVLREKLA
jgi:C-terminal processing protease CtpA/Prc